MSTRFCTLLALAVLLCYPSVVRGDDTHQPIEQGYGRIAAAIRDKNVAALWAENYLWRNPDGSLPSQQEFESAWRANFAAVDRYSSVSFSLEALTVSGQKAVAVTRRTVFYVPEGSQEVGILESTSMVSNNRRLRDVLTAKGYEVIYLEFTGGHDYLSWRGSLAHAFLSLLR